MSIHLHTLYDALYALAVVVGIACTYTLVIIAAGAYAKRAKVRAFSTGPLARTTVTQPASQTSDARELVLR